MSSDPGILLATSNGAGMGHLSRQLAVGLAAGHAMRATLFSHSIALPTVTAEGVPGEYCPGPDQRWIPEIEWPRYLRDRLVAVAEEVEAGAVVFDGVAPYRGVYLARAKLGVVPFVWFRRGMWRPGTNTAQLWKAEFFDLVIEPGDLAAADDRGPTAGLSDVIRVPPVTLLDVIDRLDRQEAARALGLDPERPTLLITLGTGRLGDSAGPGAVVLDEALRNADWQVAVTRSAVATTGVEVDGHGGVVEIHGVYPLVRYLAAFDAAVSAAGYNAVHELVASGLPTMLVPNVDTRTDDQEARSRSLARQGLALVAHPKDEGALREAVRRLLEVSVRSRLSEAVDALPDHRRLGGAQAVAEKLAELRQEPRPAAATNVKLRLLRQRDDLKESLKGFLGPSGTNRVRALLGRPPLPSVGRTPVTVVEGTSAPAVAGDRQPLFLTSQVDVDLLAGPHPVEHVLQGSSTGYRSTRRFIIDRYYDAD